MKITFNKSWIKKQVFGLLLLSFIASGMPLSASGQVAPAKKSPTAPKAAAPIKIADVVVQGQVFIVTKGGNNVKLALVNVNAYREKELMLQLDKIWEEERDERAQAVSRLNEARNASTEAQVPLNEARAKTAAAIETLKRSNYRDQSALRLMNELAAADSKLSDIYMKALGVVSLERKKLGALSSARHFIEKLTIPIASSKSDADGLFDFTLPAGSYVLVATGKRLTGDSTEFYEWIVRVDAAKGTKLMLSNDNLYETRCSECVALPARENPVVTPPPSAPKSDAEKQST